MSRSDRPIATVCAALEALFRAADPYHGLIPSILDRATGRIPASLPPGIPGQRNADRSYPGSNLIHDQAALFTAYGLAAALDRPDLAAGADRYLQRFVTHCTHTETGLFPWGEHSFWHLTEDRVGDGYDDIGRKGWGFNPVHDHLRQAPDWLWARIHAIDPQAVSRFGDGLKGHWNRPHRGEYIRHAYISRHAPYSPNGVRSCDFPRHGGFYIYDWAQAWQRAGRADLRSEITAMLDYWWLKRDQRNLLLIESRSPETERFHGTNAPAQTLSLAVSLLQSAALLDALDPALCATMRARAAAYIDGFFAAPHDPDAGVFVILSGRAENEVRETMPIWGSVYGGWPATYVALTALCGYRGSADPRLLAWASAVGRCVCDQPLPTAVAAPAMDVGLALGLLADLHSITGDPHWLDAGLALASPAMDQLCDGPAIPRGGITATCYDAQMGPSFLLHGLARLALLDRLGDACPLAADYTAR